MSRKRNRHSTAPLHLQSYCGKIADGKAVSETSPESVCKEEGRAAEVAARATAISGGKASFQRRVFVARSRSTLPGLLSGIPIYFRDRRSEPAAALTGCQLRSRDRNRNKLTQGDQASGLPILVGRARLWS
jgi:hypothetical protein